MADLSPQSWFYITEPEADAILSPNVTWPFLNITKLEFYQHDIGYAYSEIIPRTYASIICALGIIFSGLLIGTLWKKAITEKNQFYKAMLIIAVTDLGFSIGDLLVNSLYRTYEIDGSSSPIGMWIMIGVRCMTYTLSLVSDMFAVVLTLERYLAVAKPQIHKVLAEQYKSIIQPIAISVICLISATRLHYAVDRTVELDHPGHYMFTASVLGRTNFVVTMVTISDMILPFILLITMLVLSTLFRIAVLRRWQKKKQVKPTVVASPMQVPSTGWTNQNHNPEDQLGPSNPNVNSTLDVPKPQHLSDSSSERSIVALTLALDALFIVNQLGYCAYCLIELVESQYTLTYDSSREDILWWSMIHGLDNYATIVSTLAESISHAFNFPLYMALSGSMRKDFMAFMRKATRICNI